MENIDDIFKNKLSDWQLKPTDKATDLFKDRLANKKKNIFGGFSNKILRIAAGLFLIIGIGYLFIKVKNKPSLATNKSLKPLTARSETMAIKPKKWELPKNDIEHSTTKQSESKYKNSSIILKKPSAIHLEAVENRIANLDNIKLEHLEEPKKTDSEELKVDIAVNRTSFQSKNENPELIILISPDETSMPDLEIEKNKPINLVDKKTNLTANKSSGFMNKYKTQLLDNFQLNEDGFIITEAKNIKQKYYWLKARINNYN